MRRVVGHKRNPWPMMKDVTIKPRGGEPLVVGTLVSGWTGRALVQLTEQSVVTVVRSYSPAEAERIAKALLKAADVCRAKERRVAGERGKPHKANLLAAERYNQPRKKKGT